LLAENGGLSMDSPGFGCHNLVQSLHNAGWVFSQNTILTMKHNLQSLTFRKRLAVVAEKAGYFIRGSVFSEIQLHFVYVIHPQPSEAWQDGDALRMFTSFRFCQNAGGNICQNQSLCESMKILFRLCQRGISSADKSGRVGGDFESENFVHGMNRHPGEPVEIDFMRGSLTHKKLTDALKPFGRRENSHFTVGRMMAAKSLKPFCNKLKQRAEFFPVKSRLNGRIGSQNEKL
jgi:hypothetical protein